MFRRFAQAICISALLATWAGAAMAQTCAEEPSANETHASAVERISTLEQATQADPSQFWNLAALARLYHETRRYREARRAGQQALAIACDDRQRIAALGRLAETAAALGDPADAMLRTQQSLTLRRWQAEGDARPALKREIAANLDQIGALAQTRGDFAQAQSAFQESLALRRALLAGDPRSNALKREVGASLAHMGGLAFAQGDLADAQELLQESLDLARAAAAGDRSPASQQGVLTSLILAGNVAEARNDLPRARDVYQEALATARRLAAAMPGDSGPQRDAALLLERIGDLALAERDIGQARARYQESLNLRRLLAASDSAASVAAPALVRDVSASLNKVGDALVAEGDLVAARAHYEEALSIRRGLSMRAPASPAFMHDLYVSQQKIGDVAVHQGDYAGARSAYRESLAVARRAAATNPGAASNHDVWVAMWKLAELSAGMNWTQVATAMAEMQGRGALPAADADFLQQARQRAGVR